MSSYFVEMPRSLSKLHHTSKIEQEFKDCYIAVAYWVVVRVFLHNYRANISFIS